MPCDQRSTPLTLSAPGCASIGFTPSHFTRVETAQTACSGPAQHTRWLVVDQPVMTRQSQISDLRLPIADRTVRTSDGFQRDDDV